METEELKTWLKNEIESMTKNLDSGKINGKKIPVNSIVFLGHTVTAYKKILNLMEGKYD